MAFSVNSISNIRYPRTSWRSRRAIGRDIDNMLAELRKHAVKGIHLGAGQEELPGLINCDLFDPNADIRVDATNLKTFQDSSIDLIESHHLIEHLSFADADKALEEWYRVLRPRGLLVITCPDITGVCLKWLKYSILYPVYPRPDKLDYIVKMMVGSQEHEGMFHKSVYDSRRMFRLLSEHGFQVEFSYSPYAHRRRPTPSLLTIARKTG